MTRSERVAWPDVLRAVQDTQTRSALGQALRAGGFSADSFAALRKAREAVADALTTSEDTLEQRRRSPALERELGAIRSVRRRLEAELWP